MNTRSIALTDPDILAAIAELRDMISSKFPGTTYAVGMGEDPLGVYLTATVDIDDTDEVVDVFIDRLIDLQIEQGLSLYVIPVRTPERIAVWREARDAAPDLSVGRPEQPHQRHREVEGIRSFNSVEAALADPVMRSAIGEIEDPIASRFPGPTFEVGLDGGDPPSRWAWTAATRPSG